MLKKKQRRERKEVDLFKEQQKIYLEKELNEIKKRGICNKCWKLWEKKGQKSR